MNLIAQLNQRDEKSLSIVYQRYAAALLGIIYRVVGDKEVAEDVLQETFLKIWNNIQHYQPAKGRLFTWMAALARNGAIDQLRSRAHLNSRKNDDLDKVYLELDQNHQTSYNEETIGIRKLTGTLPEKQRELLELIYFQGFTQSQAAKELNIPIGTVKTRLRIAISTLRGLFIP